MDTEPVDALPLPQDLTPQLAAHIIPAPWRTSSKRGGVGIVQCGAGTDGTLGLKTIKGVSGMTMVQCVIRLNTRRMQGQANAPDLILLAIEGHHRPPAGGPGLHAYTWSAAVRRKTGDRLCQTHQESAVPVITGTCDSGPKRL